MTTAQFFILTSPGAGENPRAPAFFFGDMPFVGQLPPFIRLAAIFLLTLNCNAFFQSEKEKERWKESW